MMAISEIVVGFAPRPVMKESPNPMITEMSSARKSWMSVGGLLRDWSWGQSLISSASVENTSFIRVDKSRKKGFNGIIDGNGV